MSKLEQYIKDNRDAFDSYDPGSHIWEALETQLPAVKTKRAVRFISRLKWVAAVAVAVAVLAGVYLHPAGRT